MWGAIERISKDLQELIQRDTGTDGEDEADMAPVTINLMQQNRLLLNSLDRHPLVLPGRDT